MNYQIASKTATGTKKLYYEPNGDWYKSLETDKCVVLVVADGLGSCASDSRASHDACDSFIEKCELALSRNEMLDESAIRRFCIEIDPILARHNDMTCLSAVVWYTNTDQVVWFNVGDTRIYKCSRSGIMTQMTVDDRAVDNRRSNDPRFGRYRTINGALVPSVGVNVALGDGNHEEFHTGSFEFKPGESLILCSDGMYNSSSFSNDMAKLLGSIDMAETINRIETTDGDDNTLFVLRRDMTVDTGLDELMTQFEQDPNAIPRPALIDSFCDGLGKMLQNNANAGAIAKVAAFMKLHQMYPDRQRIDQLYNATFSKLKATAQGEEDWQQLNAACIDLKDILTYVFRH
jgi:serine/threonine protein phosphatase PrpC